MWTTLLERIFSPILRRRKKTVLVLWSRKRSGQGR